MFRLYNYNFASITFLHLINTNRDITDLVLYSSPHHDRILSIDELEKLRTWRLQPLSCEQKELLLLACPT